MSRNVQVALKVTGYPWSLKTLTYSVALPMREAQQFHRFLTDGDCELDVCGLRGTRLTGWPMVDLEGMDLCALTLAKDGTPLVAMAMDPNERASIAKAVAQSGNFQAARKRP